MALETSRILHREFRSSNASLTTLVKWTNCFSMKLSTCKTTSLRLLTTLQGTNSLELLFDNFEDSIPLDLSPWLGSSRILLHALLAEILQILPSIWTSSTLRTPCDNSPSTILLRLQTLRLHSAYAHFARLLCLTFTSSRMRTMLSLLIFQRQTLTSVNAHLAQLLCLTCTSAIMRTMLSLLIFQRWKL